ncbi:MAG: ArnT family glycosyltransferase [Solirubrobacteraceae bacterium]
MRAVRSRRSLLVAGILLVALALRLGEVARSPYVPIGDGRFYLQQARIVAHTGDYSTSSKPGTGSGGTRGPTALFPPGFPYFLAMVDLLDGHTAPRAAADPARISQAVLGTVTDALIGLVALEAFGAEVGLAALALAAIYPVLIETSSVLVAENLLIALELAAVYCGLRIRRAAHPYRWTVLAGVLAGLAALVHQDGVVLVPPLAIAAWSGHAADTSRIRALVAPAAMIVAFVLTITPWMVRNAIELHRFVPISDQAGETLFGTYNPVSAGDHQIPYKWRWPYSVTQHRSFADGAAKHVVVDASRYREPEWEGKLMGFAFDYIGAHPLSPLEVSFHNMLRLLEVEGSFAWKSSTASIGLQRGVARIGVLSFWAVLILAVLGVLTSYARRAPRWIWLVPILFFLSTVWVRAETPRFRLPIDPFLVLLAACALAWCAVWLRGLARKRGPVAARERAAAL